MKIAVFSDVHGNLLNLVSCYESISRLNVDACICLGDIGNYYPETRGVIGFLKQKRILCLRGNHDQMYLSPQTLSDEKKAQYSFDLSMTGSREYIEYLSS